MITASLFQWVELKQDVPNSPVKVGNRGVVLDYLRPSKTQQEPGYILEVFQDGETLDVVSVPVSWVNPLPETWGSVEHDTKQTESKSSKTPRRLIAIAPSKLRYFTPRRKQSDSLSRKTKNSYRL